jgi:uncharacterized protein (DUF58 family)
MIRPTRQALFLVLAGLPLMLLALIDEGLWAVGIGYTALTLALIGADAALSQRPSRITLAIDAPAALGVGTSGEVVLRFAGVAAADVPALEAVCDMAGEAGPGAGRAVFATGEREPVARVLLSPGRRGEIVIERAWLRWRGPWGFIVRQDVRDVGRTVAVTPDIAKVRAAATQFVMRDTYVGIKVRRELGGGTDFDALAEYMPGQDRRGIDWKRSARHRKLLVKEFQAERNHNVVLAIDTGHLMSEPVDGQPRLDHAINAGLMLAWLSLRTGDRVGLMGFDVAIRHYVGPQSGLGGFARLLEASARLDYRPEETNFTLALTDLASRLSRRALVVVFTEFVDTITAELMVENMGRLARRHLVVFATIEDPTLDAAARERPGSLAAMARAVIASEMIRERAVVIERIRRLGVHCVSAPAPGLATGLIDRYLVIRREELV